MQDIEDAGGQPCFKREPAETCGRERTLLRWLENNGIPEGEGRRDLPARLHRRKVPRTNRRDDPGRRVKHIREASGIRVRLRTEEIGEVGEEAEVAVDAGNVHCPCLADRLAHITDVQQGQLFGMSID